MRLIDTSTAALYVPGLIDTFVKRSAEGLWFVDPMAVMEANAKKGHWSGKYLDPKDIYAEDADSVETILNEKVFNAVNKAMFDESERTTVP